MRTVSYGGMPESDSSVWWIPGQSSTPVKTSAPVPAATKPGNNARPSSREGISPLAAATSKSRKAATTGPPNSAAIAENAPASVKSLASVP